VYFINAIEFSHSSSLLFVTACNADFHTHRTQLVEHTFAFHPAMEQYINTKYSFLLQGDLETVSLHVRGGGADEVDPRELRRRKHPSNQWYSHVMRHLFNVPAVIFVCFTDNKESLNMLLTMVSQKMAPVKVNYIIVDEDYAMSLLLMSRCQHHIGASSTFSFWGAYLDPRQPNGGRTVFPPQYLMQHQTKELPFPSWHVPPEPT
jgi:hypothetical protein